MAAIYGHCIVKLFQLCWTAIHNGYGSTAYH